MFLLSVIHILTFTDTQTPQGELHFSEALFISSLSRPPVLLHPIGRYQAPTPPPPPRPATWHLHC